MESSLTSSINQKVSIIIPVYNVEKYLSRCLNSAINQTYKNVEIVAIDDGSTDSSLALLEEAKEKDSRIKIIHEENHGVSFARETGLQNATGDFICWLDPDDWMDPDLVEYCIQTLSQTKTKLIMFDYYLFNTKCEVASHCNPEIDKEVVLTKHQAFEWLLNNKIEDHLWACLASKELYEGFHFPDYQAFEDVYTYSFLLEKADSVVWSPKNKYHYYMRGDSLIHVSFSCKKNLDELSALLYRRKLVSENQPDLLPKMNSVIMEAYVASIYPSFCKAYKKEHCKSLKKELTREYKEIHKYYSADHGEFNYPHTKMKVHLFFISKKVYLFVLAISKKIIKQKTYLLPVSE